MEKQWETLFWGGSKITADGDCSHEIKRLLLLGRKAMTNLDSILKSRDITLPTKVSLVKAMVFPVVMYVWMWELDCKVSWALKNWCFQTVVLEKTLESPLDSKEIKSVNPRGNQPWISIGRTVLEALIIWPLVKSWLIGKDLDTGKDWRQKEKRAAEDEIDSIAESMDMNLSKLWEIIEDRGDWPAAVHRITKSQIQLSNWTTTTKLN